MLINRWRFTYVEMNENLVADLNHPSPQRDFALNLSEGHDSWHPHGKSADIFASVSCAEGILLLLVLMIPSELVVVEPQLLNTGHLVGWKP